MLPIMTNRSAQGVLIVVVVLFDIIFEGDELVSARKDRLLSHADSIAGELLRLWLTTSFATGGEVSFLCSSVGRASGC